jgi:glycosyltransferase involved in cell wall biosynthesis
MKNKKLTLSLVIPVFDEEGYLEACLSAIANQTLMPDEVIVVNNGSTDRTAALAKQFRFVKLIQEPRRGVIFARNRGFNAARGQIIGRIDADTILPPRWTEKIKTAFEDKTITAVTGPVSYYDMPFPQVNHFPDHLMRSSIYNWSPKSPFLFGSNMAIRKTAWNGIRKELCSHQNIHEDLDLAVHLYLRGQKILYDKRLLAGASGRRYNDNFAQFFGYMSMYRRTYLSHGLHSLAGYAAVTVYWLGYAIVHPARYLWFRLAGSVQPLESLSRQARKNPMES